MGLEVPVYVNDLVTTNPVSSDDISQGDDHLRNLKVALKQTFPNSSRAFYFPANVTLSTSQALTSADSGKLCSVDATSGAITVTLPSLGSSDDGWVATIIKIDSSANVVTVAGTINGVANFALGKQFAFLRVAWNGTAWYATGADNLVKPISKTANYTVLSSELNTIFLISPAANTTITLPTAVGKAGNWLLIKKVTTSVNTVVVDPNAAETIDGSTTFTVADTQTIWIVSDGTNWQIIAMYGGSGSGIPAGASMDYWGATVPSGWLECGGQAVSRTTFAALFVAIGTLYGVGDGSTTFNVPDARGRVVAGEDDMGLGLASRITVAGGNFNGATLGAAGGGQNVTLSAAQSGIAAHTHTANHKYRGIPTGSGSLQLLTTVAEATTDGVDTGYNTGSATATAAASATPLLQPTIIAKKIIKT